MTVQCRSVTLFLSWMVWGLCSPAGADIPVTEPFGQTVDGTPVSIFEIANEHGMSVTLMNLGPTIIDIIVPDKKGDPADVNLGLDSVELYQTKSQGFGKTIGRVAGRIKDGKFMLNGKEVDLDPNSDKTILHGGGKRALGNLVWKAKPFEDDRGEGVEFRITSPDGEEGFPGTVKFMVMMLVAKHANELHFEYRATTDKPTPISLTNHSYINLAGEGNGTILDHELQIFADQYTLFDNGLVLTGELADLAGLPIDFREPHAIGERIEAVSGRPTSGYDHNFVIRGKPGTLRPVLRLKDPQSGRVLSIDSTQPSLEIYTANHMQGNPGKKGKTYVKNAGIAMETQHDPNAVNLPSLPSMVITPDKPYFERAIWRFTAE